jgi:hypothetical protein
VRLSSRDSDDADVIRARLRVLLDEGDRAGGWLPDELDGLDADWNHLTAGPAGEEVEDGATVPCEDPEEAADARSGLPAGIGRHRAPGPTPRWAVALDRRPAGGAAPAGLDVAGAATGRARAGRDTGTGVHGTRAAGASGG